MKNIIVLSIITVGLMMSSCGGTKNMVEETPLSQDSSSEVVAKAEEAKPKKKDRRGPGMEDMFAELNMSDEQIAKYKLIDQKYQTKMKATMNADDRMAMATKIKSLQEDRKKEVKGILTADQYTQYLAWLDKAARYRGPRN